MISQGIRYCVGLILVSAPKHSVGAVVQTEKQKQQKQHSSLSHVSSTCSAQAYTNQGE